MWFYFDDNNITFQSVPKSEGSKWLLRVKLPYEAKQLTTKSTSPYKSTKY